jgi:hypothetical protein
MPKRDEFLMPDECLELVRKMGWLENAVKVRASGEFQRLHTFFRSAYGRDIHEKRLAQTLLYSIERTLRNPKTNAIMYSTGGFVSREGRLPTPADDGYVVLYRGDSLIRDTPLGIISDFKLTRRK